MIPSGNDAANAIADHIAGSTDAFVEKMNAKGKELGATLHAFCQCKWSAQHRPLYNGI